MKPGRIIRAVVAWFIITTVVAVSMSTAVYYEGILDRRQEGSVVLFGADAFWYMLPGVYLTAVIVTVIGLVVVALVSWVAKAFE